MYFFFRQNLFDANNTLEIVGHTELTGALLWTTGVKFKKPLPHQTLMLDPTYGDTLPDFFDCTVPVISERLIKALHNLDIYNFDSYPVTLKRIDNGKEYDNFKAINFIGNIDAINYQQSDFERNKRGKPRRFKSIVINNEIAKEHKAFRLSVGPDFLVVNQKIAGQLSQYSFSALLLQKTTDFDGF